MSVVVLAEGTPSFETMDQARTIARALETTLLVYVTREPTPAITAALKLRPEDRVVVVPGLASFSADRWLSTFANLLAAVDATVVLVADSAHSRAYFPALALRLKKALLSGATRVRVRAAANGGALGTRLEVERPIHGGLQTERLLVNAPLFVTLLASGESNAVPEASAENEAAPGARAIAWCASCRRMRRRSTSDRPIASSRAAWGSARRRRSRSLPRLAKLLHAAVGGTRVISDRGWLPHERYIGSTGKTVAPKLYFALGISGASQHLVGITESEAIVAINTDRAAPIFGVADLGVVGDLHAIVPELEKRLVQMNKGTSQ